MITKERHVDCWFSGEVFLMTGFFFFFDTSFENECKFFLKNFLPNQNQNLATEEDKAFLPASVLVESPRALPRAEDEGR